MKFFPDEKYKTIFDIPFEDLKEKGIKYILFDYDDTITSRKSEVPSDETIKLIHNLKKIFEIIIFSNNFEKRVSITAEALGVDYVSSAFKPLKKNYEKLFKRKTIFKHEVCAIGDTFCTDIIGGNRMEIMTIKIDKCKSGHLLIKKG